MSLITKNIKLAITVFKQERRQIMKLDKIITRRNFFKTAGAGVATSVISTSVFLNAARAKAQEEWRLAAVLSDPFPELELFTQMVSEGTDGRLRIKVVNADEIGPPLETIEAVRNGTVEMGHGVPAYWARKVPAMVFLTLLPFGLTAQEQNAWFEFGGGQELADKIYAELGCKFFLCGNTGAQMGGWFKNEINSIDDLKGIKMRIGGYGGAIMKSVGVELVRLPFSGKALAQALQEGKIEAAEFIGPAPDMEAGLYKHAKYYYYPAWHEPSAAMDLFINKAKWEALPNDHKAVIKTAAAAVNNRILCHNCYLNSAALSKLVNEHNVQLREYSSEMLQKFRQVSDKIIQGQASKDNLTQEVLNSIGRFQKEASGWSMVSLQSFLNARNKV
jgi:TRAP-type mannitol/chloroaromatic compound transport system substrate-binding protein